MMSAIKACAILFTGVTVVSSVTAREPSDDQVKEWQRLYPKLNSKMARMEELLNYIERFLGVDSFRKEMLSRSLEFTYLTKQSGKNIPEYLSKEERKKYLLTIKKSTKLAESLYTFIDQSKWKKGKKILKDLHKIRKKSHAKWAE